MREPMTWLAKVHGAQHIPSFTLREALCSDSAVLAPPPA